MGRSSRHKSHRSHKHRDRSDSEEDVHSRDRRPTVEAAEDWVSEPEKRRSSLGNGVLSIENGKKRKDHGEDSLVADRWNGGSEDDRVEKETMNDENDTERTLEPKVTSVDLKGKSSSRRREGSSERNEEKRGSEKESSQRESATSGRYKDRKEKEREREREPESNKKVQDSRNERVVDSRSRREERTLNKDTVIPELQDEMCNPELEKELEKCMKRRDGSGDNNNLRDDGKETDARRVSSKDDHSKNGSYKDDRYKEGRYKEKYRHDLDRDQRQRDDKRRDEHSRIQTSDRSDKKYSRDENRLPQGRYKTKLQNIDHDGSPYVDDRKSGLKDNRGRKRSSDENEDSSDVKRRNTKDSQEDTQRNGSRYGKPDSHIDRGREQPHPVKVVSGLSNSHPKSSGSTAYAVEDEIRDKSRQAEFSSREPLSEETQHPPTTSRADRRATSDGRERVSESRSMEKTKLKDDTRSNILVSGASAASHLSSDIHRSPNHLTSDQLFDGTGARRDVEEVGQRSSNYKDGRSSSSSKDIDRDWGLPMDRLKGCGSSQMDLPNCDPTSLGPSSYNGTTSLQGSSPGHAPPPPPAGLGVDRPSVLGSYEDENRNHNPDRKTNKLCERSGDVSAGRGPATPWKSTPTWSPAPHGFMPLQHGPPGGFHPAVQFPAPPLYGVRPLMGSYHPTCEANRFSGHAHPYDCPPHLQLWDGSNDMFNNESRIYGRPDWDQNRHLMGNRGWEFSVGMYGQNGNVNMEFPCPRKEQECSTQTLADETWAGKSGHSSRDERVLTELPTTESGGINQPMDSSPAIGTPKVLREKVSEPSNMPIVQKTSEEQSDNYVTFCCNYLYKLDVSPNLVQPELYEKYVALVGARDGVVAANSIIRGHQESNKSQDARVAAKRKNYFFNSHSSTSIDDVFQRAMSLYDRQKETVKELMNPGLRLASSEEEKVPSAPDVTKVNSGSPNNREDELPKTGAIPASPMEVENRTAIDTDTKSEHPEDDMEAKQDNPTDAEEKQCGNISESVVLAEGSEDCQALMPECSVNLSRIHLSLESTH